MRSLTFVLFAGWLVLSPAPAGAQRVVWDQAEVVALAERLDEAADAFESALEKGPPATPSSGTPDSGERLRDEADRLETAAATLADPATAVRRCAGETCSLFFSDHKAGRARLWCDPVVCGQGARIERRRSTAASARTFFQEFVDFRIDDLRRKLLRRIRASCRRRTTDMPLGPAATAAHSQGDRAVRTQRITRQQEGISTVGDERIATTAAK